MSEYTDTITCKVFFGFGGSGGETLKSLAQMFAADKQWANRCENEAYFIVADTDEKDLEKSRAGILNPLAGQGLDVHVDALLLSSGVRNMSEEVSRQLDGHSRNEDARKRLSDSWWFDTKGNPFVARELTAPPSDGAGQCPAISHYLAWRALAGSEGEMEKVIQRLYDTMANRVMQRAHARDFRVQLFIVAGLAGGTGRGSWATLSFKIRQFFKEKGNTVAVRGVFFDYSCFEDTAGRKPDQRAKLIVNSLTGVSEIHGWLVNDGLGKDERFVLRMPSLHNPLDKRQDVIDAGQLVLEGETLKGVSPVQSAWLLFSRSDAGKLVSKSHYQIAAAGMYAYSSEGKIKSMEINTQQDMGTIGTRTYRVDVDAISAYLRDRLEYEAAASFTASSAPQVAKLIGYYKQALVPSPVDSAEPASCAVGDLPGRSYFSERINERIRTLQHGTVSKLVGRLEKADPKTWARLTEEALSIPEGDEQIAAEVLDALKESIKAVFGSQALADEENLIGGGKGTGEAEDGSKLLVGFLAKSLRASVHGEDAHLTSMQAAANLMDGIAKELAQMGSWNAAVEWAPINDRIAKLGRKEYIVAGPRFNTKERAEIDALLSTALVRQGRYCTAKILQAWGASAQKALAAWRSNLAVAIESAKQHAQGRAEAVGATTPKEKVNLRVDGVFTITKDFIDLGNEDAASEVAPELVLQPVGDEAAHQRWMTELHSNKDQRFQEAISAISERCLNEAIGKGDAEYLTTYQTRRLQPQLRQLWKQLGDSVSVPKRFIEKTFNLKAVVRDLYDTWAKQIDEAKSDPRRRQRLLKAFKLQFGFDIGVDSNQQCEIQDEAEILRKMALYLGATCRPQYLRRTTASSQPGVSEVLVFMPSEVLEGSESELVRSKRIKEQEGLLHAAASKAKLPELQFFCSTNSVGDAGRTRGNPYMMMAVCLERFPRRKDGKGEGPIDLDAVASLSHYIGAGETVDKLLEAVEEADGRSMFEVGDSIGLGYVFPAFVTNPTLQRVRWKPWMEHRQGEKARKQSHAIEVLAYMLLRTAGTKFDGQMVAENDGTTHDWSLPLLKVEDVSGRTALVATRQGFSCEASGWRPRLSKFRADHEFGSFKRTLETLEAEKPLLDALRNEAKHYFAEVCDVEDLVAKDFQRLWLNLKDYLNDEVVPDLSKLSNYERDYKAVLESLLATVDGLSAKSRVELVQVYKA